MAQFLTDSTFADFVGSSAVPVLVDIYRDGCLPCRRVAPLLSKAGETYEGQLAIARINLDQNPGLTAQLAIEAAPTLVAFRNGVEIARHRGVIDRVGLEALIQTILN